MQKRPAARPDGPTARSAAERTSPAAAVVQRVVRVDNRPATGNLPQLAAVVRAGAGAVTSRRGPAAPGGTAPVVQRAVRVGAQGAEILYTEVADAVAAAKKAGVDLTAVIPVITPWFNDGLTHDYATWQLFAAAAHGLPAPAVTAPVAEAPALSDSESAHSDELESPRDNAPRTPGSPARSESDTDSDSGAEAAARLRARLDKRSESSASAPRSAIPARSAWAASVRFTGESGLRL